MGNQLQVIFEVIETDTVKQGQSLSNYISEGNVSPLDIKQVRQLELTASFTSEELSDVPIWVLYELEGKLKAIRSYVHENSLGITLTFSTKSRVLSKLASFQTDLASIVSSLNTSKRRRGVR